MAGRQTCGATLLAVLTACGGGAWPNPPAIDPALYDSDYRIWLDQRQTVAAEAVRLIGVWPLPEGDTPFGSDPSLPIALPGSSVPAKAGTFRREAERVSVLPAGPPVGFENGTLITAPSEVAGR